MNSNKLMQKSASDSSTVESLVQERLAVLITENEQLKKELAQKQQREQQLPEVDKKLQETEALRESERRLQNIISTNADGLVVVDGNGNVRFVSPAAETLFGRPAAELLDHFLGLPISENVTEVTIRRPDGESIVTEMRVAEIIWEEEKAYLASLRDIAERKKTEEALKESEERFRLMADTAPVLIWMSGTDGECTFFNNFWLNFTGGTLEEELGNAWEKNIYPDDLQEFQAIYLSSFKMQQSFQAKYRLRRADGKYRWLLATGVPRFTSSGEFAGYIGSCIDITEQKELEEALLRISKAVESSSEAIAILDVTGKSLYHNPAFVELFEYTVDELNKIGDMAVVFCKRDYPRYRTIFSTILSGKSWRGELTIRSPKGKVRKRQISLHADAIKEQTGKIVGLVITCNDITESKRVERQLKETNTKLKSSIKQLETSNHDIVMLGEMIELLQACLSVEEANKVLKMIIPQLFDEVSGGLFIFNEASNPPTTVVIWGTNIDGESRFNPNECWALRKGYLSGQEKLSPNLSCQNLCDNIGAGESLCVPMTAKGGNLGLLHLSLSKKGRLTEAKKHLAITVSEHIALALSNLKLREKLQQECIRDPLTGLFNRRYLNEFLEREIHRVDRADKPLGIIMIDIDHFKRFNDQFSHDAGDEVLRQVSHFLEHCIRSSDIACRYGGEELILILPEANLQQTCQRAEEIRLGIKSLALEYHNQPLGAITISLGVACFPEHGKKPQKLIQMADAALYQAKAQGRDQVVISH